LTKAKTVPSRAPFFMGNEAIPLGALLNFIRSFTSALS
jgi:hypothetical protein